MEFHYPWMLLTVLTVPMLYWIFRRRKRPTVVIPTVKAAASLRAVRRRSVLEISILIALILLSLALARPRRPAGDETIRSQGLDIILALDMSGSMRAIDRPAGMDNNTLVSKINAGQLPTRLEAAKEEIRRFIQARPNDRIGLIGFADLAYSFVPPTLDHNLLLERLAALQPGEIGERTGLASPIGVGVERLRRSDAPRRVLVLFTDGTNTVENRLTPGQAAELAKEFNVIIHTVGIGSDDAYAVTDTVFGSQLQRASGSFDAAMLQELSGISGGSFFQAADAAGLKRTMAEINKLEKTTLEGARPVEYEEFAPCLALAAAGVLLFGIVAETTWQMRLP